MAEFGNCGIGAFTDDWDKAVVYRFTAPLNMGTVYQMQFHLGSDFGAFIKGGIWNVSDLSLVAATDGVPVIGGEASREWNTVLFGVPVPLAPGTDYYFGFMVNAHVRYDYDVGTPGYGFYSANDVYAVPGTLVPDTFTPEMLGCIQYNALGGSGTVNPHEYMGDTDGDESW